MSLCSVLLHHWQSSHVWQYFLTWVYNLSYQYSINMHQYVDSTLLCSVWSCKFLIIFFWLSESLTTHQIFIFLLSWWNNSEFCTRYFRAHSLNVTNVLSHMSAEHYKVTRYLTVDFCFSEYFESEFRTDCQTSSNLLSALWSALTK